MDLEPSIIPGNWGLTTSIIRDQVHHLGMKGETKPVNLEFVENISYLGSFLIIQVFSHLFRNCDSGCLVSGRDIFSPFFFFRLYLFI